MSQKLCAVVEVTISVLRPQIVPTLISCLYRTYYTSFVVIFTRTKSSITLLKSAVLTCIFDHVLEVDWGTQNWQLRFYRAAASVRLGLWRHCWVDCFGMPTVILGLACRGPTARKRSHLGPGGRGRVFSLRDLSARLLDGSRWKSRRRADIRPPLSRRPSVAQVPAVPRRRCRTPIITRRTIIAEDHSKNAAASLYIPPLERRRNKAYEKLLFTVVE